MQSYRLNTHDHQFVWVHHKMQQLHLLCTYLVFLYYLLKYLDRNHLQFFENIQDCNVYMLENKLYTTHLVFDLTSAKCVNVHESTNNNITHY